MKSNYRRYWLLWVFVCIAHLVSAQILNVEDKRIDREDTSGWFGYIDVGFDLVNNGSEVISFRGAFRVDYIKERHLFFALSNYNLIKAAGKDFVNNGFQHFRYNYQLNDWLIWEAFLQGQRNELIQLNFRGLVGGGPRVRLLKNYKVKSWLGLLYMYEYNDESGPDIIFRDHRLSTYLSLNYQPSAKLGIASITYFQPIINNFKDFRLSSQTSLRIGISDRLNFRTSFNITYDTQVPEGVVNTFYSFENGVRWEF